MIDHAVAAWKHGYTPLPLHARNKAPAVSQWTRLSWADATEEQVREKFTEWCAKGSTNLGLVLGAPSGGLVDVDLDHPVASRLRDMFLPETPMRTGRASRRNSHYWYKVTGEVPGSRRYKMADGSVSVELRSTQAQTAIPPSIHPSGENYLWEGAKWGGRKGPAEIDGKLLSVRVATLGLATLLVDNWPKRGSRHDAYLALAGGLLRYGDEGRVHPFWEKSLPSLIGAMSVATLDDDGPEQRIKEVMGTTLRHLRDGENVVGFGTLADHIGEDAVKQAKRMVREIASRAGFESEFSVYVDDPDVSDEGDEQEVLSAQRSERQALASEDLEPDQEPDPLDLRASTWEQVNLDPYLAGEVQPPVPEVMLRSDGKGLMYSGRVNMLYGSSESAKSWIALHVCLQEMGKGERVVYLDFEDEPVNTLDRMRRLGAGPDDIRLQFAYIRPEEPLEQMQRNKWGKIEATSGGRLNQVEFDHVLARIDPTLIIVDGMTVLYGLHGLDSNDATATDVITGWLKKLTRNGRSTVIVIDHTVKNPERGSMPLGSQHKVSMVQGTLLQVWPIKRPRRGAVGEMDLIVLKDRPGGVREIAADPGSAKDRVQIAARVVMDSSAEGITVMEVVPPGTRRTRKGATDPEAEVEASFERSREAERIEREREWEEKVLYAFGGEIGRSMSLKEVRLKIGTEVPSPVRRAVKRLVVKGWLSVSGSTRDRSYTLVIGGGGYEDDPAPQPETPTEPVPG